jgi:hypothetical protein
LIGLGFISENGVRSNYTALGMLKEDTVKSFHSLMNPLKNKFSKSPIIFFESCSIACGPIDTVDRRMKSLMTFLGVQNATIYAAKQSYVNHRDALTIGTLKPFAKHAIVFGGYIVFLSAYSLGIGNSIVDLASSLGALIGLGFVSSTLSLGIVKSICFGLEKLKLINQGYLLSYQDLTLKEAVILNGASVRNKILASKEHSAQLSRLDISNCSSSLSRLRDL